MAIVCHAMAVEWFLAATTTLDDLDPFAGWPGRKVEPDARNSDNRILPTGTLKEQQE